MRVGSNHSSILLETAARNSYPFILLRTRGDVEVSAPASPIEAEGWLALGFPALRTISSDRPSGSSSEAASTPRVEDVLPLVKGDADFRLDQLQQWIVRLFNSANAAQVNGGDGAVYRRLLDKFFDVVGNLTEGVRIKLGTVDPKSERVTVITDDGEVPLALVSQGTASLIGWIGVVLQRLYEIYGGDEDPTQRYVLVLMDEIDAHMHPEWQRKLIPKLQSIFPNMQLVATTHSPLIVSGLKSENVFLVERRDGKVGVRQFPMKLQGQGTDEILTGPLFNLSDTTDVGTEAKLERYIALRSSDQLDSDARIERNKLAQELFGRNGEDLSRQTSEVSRLVEKSLADQAEQRPPEEKKRILDEAERLIEATFAGISPERLR